MILREWTIFHQTRALGAFHTPHTLVCKACDEEQQKWNGKIKYSWYINEFHLNYFSIVHEIPKRNVNVSMQSSDNDNVEGKLAMCWWIVGVGSKTQFLSLIDDEILILHFSSLLCSIHFPSDICSFNKCENYYYDGKHSKQNEVECV
jgi:hypothetical protein